MAGTVLARGLGFHGTVAALNKRVGKEFRTLLAEDNGVPGDGCYVMQLQVDHRFFQQPMMVMAVDLDEVGQGLQISMYGFTHNASAKSNRCAILRFSGPNRRENHLARHLFDRLGDDQHFVRTNHIRF